jgi:hypothetical protein
MYPSIGARPFSGVAVSASVVADHADHRRTEMGKIIISENISLDGVVQDPTGEEGFSEAWYGAPTQIHCVVMARQLLAESLAMAFELYQFKIGRGTSGARRREMCSES